MAKEFLANRGKQPASGVDSVALNAETLAPAMRPTGTVQAVTEEGSAAQRGLPPVEQWNPPFCGDIDMRIARDGTWFYCATPIARPALVRLFSTILRKDPGGYVLVTPAEKLGIQVEDAPFLAVEMTVTGKKPDQLLRFLTNVGIASKLGPAIRCASKKPPSAALNPISMCGAVFGRGSPAPCFSISPDSAK